MPQEKAAERERLLYKEYLAAKEKSAKSLYVYKVYQDNIKKAGSLRIEINKADTLEGKLRAALEIVGILTGDGDFQKRNMKGVGEGEFKG